MAQILDHAYIFLRNPQALFDLWYVSVSRNKFPWQSMNLWIYFVCCAASKIPS